MKVNISIYFFLFRNDNIRPKTSQLLMNNKLKKKLREENGEDYEDWRREGGRYTPCNKYKDRYMKCYKGIRRCLCKVCFSKHGLELSKIFTK